MASSQIKQCWICSPLFQSFSSVLTGDFAANPYSRDKGEISHCNECCKKHWYKVDILDSLLSVFQATKKRQENCLLGFSRLAKAALMTK